VTVTDNAAGSPHVVPASGSSILIPTVIQGTTVQGSIIK
jgi:hypothetical protein